MRDEIKTPITVALVKAGCVDVDAALKVMDVGTVQSTMAGVVDAESVGRTIAAFQAAKPHFFSAPEKKAEPAPKSALDMSEAEYEAAKRKLILDGEWARRRPTMDPGTTKDAREMTDAEYRQALRNMGVPEGRTSFNGQ
jgi:hypothetical protein